MADTREAAVAPIRMALAASARQFIVTAFVPDVRTFMLRFMSEVAGGVGGLP